MRHSLTIIAFAAALAAAVGTAPAGAAVDRRQAAMDNAVQAGIPGVLAVAADYSGQFHGSSGVAEIHGSRRPDTTGRFRIASVSKTFTATLVLQLAGAGRLGLDDQIGRYLPGLLPYPEPITVRQLLQHTSGLPRDLPVELSWATLPEIDTERFVHLDEAEQVRASTTQPLLFEPGSSWSYSNTGYNVLAMLVEKVTGQPLERVLADRITGPLGLRDTFLPRDFPILLRPAAHGYEQLYPAPHELTDVTVYNYSRYFGAGNLVSSATDLNLFFHALLGGELLPANVLKEMKTTVPAIGPDGTYQGFDYGLGLMHIPLSPICGTGPAVWGHGGDVFGFGTWSMHDERGEQQITTLATQDITPSPEAAVKRTLVMVNEFCTPQQTLSPNATRVAKVAL